MSRQVQTKYIPSFCINKKYAQNRSGDNMDFYYLSPPLRKRTPTECIQGNGPTPAVASSAYFINKTSQQDYNKEYNNT